MKIIITISFALIGMLMSCSPKKAVAQENTTQMKPGLVHTVFFWVNEGTSEDEVLAFEKGLEKLGTCPQPQLYYWGPPAATDQRGVVDGSYHYAINVHFENMAAHDAYQVEPIHLEFIENHNHIWEKVVVYDNDVR